MSGIGRGDGKSHPRGFPSRGTVRFAEGTQGPSHSALTMVTRGGDDDDTKLEETTPRRKRPRHERPNEDELDDVDEWNDTEEQEDDAPSVPTEHELLQAKQERRRKRQNGGPELEGDEVSKEGRTSIDNSTSLASEGIEIEPFHMHQESSDGTGYFDGDTYVFRKVQEEDEEPDAWLESLSSRNDESEREQRGHQPLTKPQPDFEKSNMDDWPKESLYAKIIPLVSDTETVMQAIARYGHLLKRKHKTGANIGSNNANDESRKFAQSALNDLTGAANALLLKGNVDIYQKTRKELVCQLPPQLGRMKTATKQKALWEYMGNQDGAIHGPFTTEQMHGWIAQGYFVGPTAVQVRSVIEQPKETSLKDDLLSDLMDDDDDTAATPSALERVRGDWMQSDQVVFTSYT